MTTLTNKTLRSSDHDIPQDDHLPGLPLMMDAAKVTEVLRDHASMAGLIESCQIAYVRFKPATNCLVAYRVMLKDDKSSTKQSFLFGKCFTASDYLNAAAKLSEEAKVSKAIYYFATPAGDYEKKECPATPEVRETLVRVLRTLDDTARAGVFAPTAEEESCQFCDVKAACGSGREQQAQRKKADPRLAAFLKLRDIA